MTISPFKTLRFRRWHHWFQRFIPIACVSINVPIQMTVSFFRGISHLRSFLASEGGITERSLSWPSLASRNIYSIALTSCPVIHEGIRTCCWFVSSRLKTVSLKNNFTTLQPAEIIPFNVEILTTELQLVSANDPKQVLVFLGRTVAAFQGLRFKDIFFRWFVAVFEGYSGPWTGPDKASLFELRRIKEKQRGDTGILTSVHEEPLVSHPSLANNLLQFWFFNFFFRGLANVLSE